VFLSGHHSTITPTPTHRLWN